VRNGQQAALAVDTVDLMDALAIDSAVIGGFDWGARSANIVGALWPERCTAMVSVSGYLIGSQAANQAPLPPAAELAWWYQYYFATKRGRDGYDKYRREFAKLIWRTASPKWTFDDATFDRSAASFANEDHVSIVIHNYRWRLGLAAGERRYDDVEEQLAEGPVIKVPTITLGAPSCCSPGWLTMMSSCSATPRTRPRPSGRIGRRRGCCWMRRPSPRSGHDPSRLLGAAWT
jgi:pimeloyl-ACP methyl ester carboxylesterase